MKKSKPANVSACSTGITCTHSMLVVPLINMQLSSSSKEIVEEHVLYFHIVFFFAFTREKNYESRRTN